MNLPASISPIAAPSRLAWIDWMRGMACILMFQTHCYDAWLGGDARNSSFLERSQLLGTLPAPMFLFLAGVSFALIITKLTAKNLTPAEVTGKMARRGAEILAFGLLFRLQEYVIAWGWAPWSDLFRVDILNTIGVSMILMALLCGVTLIFANAGGVRRETTLTVSAIVAAAVIALLTPPLYTTWRPTWLPWPLESYIDGCHNLGAPQSWLFPLFPWSAFAFAGLAAGFVLFTDKAQAHSSKTLGLFSAVGIVGILAAYALDHSSIHIYSVYDYWHTSPNFLMMRVGLLLVIAFLSYAWCNWGLGTRGFSPLIQLGQTSLLVYWVHIEFVYGRFSILPKRAQSIATASRGLIEIILFMLVLSLLRTRINWKKFSWQTMTRRVQPA
ncbi:MAG TPA: heparan-alpha-glucosaminide N-acetyltransferase domain-containing protein [Terriglobales bacterium]|nr:heparan-alpha-glucosaminide N-acetyltransferase domain-containing protein [Terriglobales bacterium]